jgi:hypothetical protein
MAIYENLIIFTKKNKLKISQKWQYSASLFTQKNT